MNGRWSFIPTNTLALKEITPSLATQSIMLFKAVLNEKAAVFVGSDLLPKSLYCHQKQRQSMLFLELLLTEATRLHFVCTLIMLFTIDFRICSKKTQLIKELRRVEHLNMRSLRRWRLRSDLVSVFFKWDTMMNKNYIDKPFTEKKVGIGSHGYVNYIKVHERKKSWSFDPK